MVHHEWGLLIVVYLFLGGLGAGCLVLSGLAQLVPGGRFGAVARGGALLAPVLVALGCGLLVFDLGRPLSFWRLGATIEFVSPMSIGFWLLALFVPVGLATAVVQAPHEWLAGLAGRLPGLARPLGALARWSSGGGPPRAAARFAHLPSTLAIVGIPLGLGVGIYTGVLLGAIPARPFWNTPMVAQLFLFSALSTASALLLLTLPLFARVAPPTFSIERRALLGADLVFIFLELFIIIPFIVHGELSALSARDALGMILGGPYTLVFWGGVVALGIVMPGIVEAGELLGATRRWRPVPLHTLHLAVPLFVLVGGFLLRWVFVHAGQDTGFAE